MHAVNDRREGVDRNRTHTAPSGQVPDSHPNTVQLPLSTLVSQVRSPLIEQFNDVAQRSPIVGVQALSKRRRAAIQRMSARTLAGRRNTRTAPVSTAISRGS